MASPETVPRDDETTVTITARSRLGLGEIDEAYGRRACSRRRRRSRAGPRGSAARVFKGIFPRPASDAGRARLRPHGPAPRLHAGLAREDGRLVRGPPAGV